VPSRPITGLEERLVAVAKRCSPPVVAIVTDRGAGSGVVISSDGLILTNEHVISGRRSIEAQFPSGEKRVARILGRDAMSDIALLQVQATGLPAMAMGDSDQVQVGQVVAALGNPFGLSRDGKPAMTVGIISALHRIVAPGNGNRRYGDAIQTDAAINPGNSGGALVDLDGKLIGINGAISSKTGTSSGVGFAIPINFVKRILPDLKEGRSPRPGFLGITVRDLTAEESTRTRHRGAVVTSVQPGSPAQRARFRTGQLITRFEGRVVSSSTDLINRISYYQAGALVRVRLLQSDGTERDVSVRIGSR
jgi:S1-C subfamily serine protease